MSGVAAHDQEGLVQVGLEQLHAAGRAGRHLLDRVVQLDAEVGALAEVAADHLRHVGERRDAVRDAVAAHQLEDVLHAGLSRDGHHRLGLVGGERAQAGSLPPAMTTAFTSGIFPGAAISGQWRSGVRLAAGPGQRSSGVAARTAAVRRARTARWPRSSPRGRRTGAPRRQPSQPNRAAPNAPIVGHTAIRPIQLMCRSRPARSAAATATEHEHLARHQHRERPPRQQLEVPHDDDAGDHHEPVDQRVHQGAQAAVLARDARRDPVQVVGRRPRARSTWSRTARARRRRRARPRRTRRAARSARSRSRFGIVNGRSGAPARVCGGSGPPLRRPSRRPAPMRRLLGHQGSSSSSARERGGGALDRHRALLGAAPHLHLQLAGLEAALAGDHAQRAARAAPPPRTSRRGACRGRRRGPRGPPRAAPRTGARRARAPSVPGLPRPTRCTSKGAIARGHEMPCSSAYCSIAAAAIRAGPMP